MEYPLVLDLWLTMVLCAVLCPRHDVVLAQTEGDTGYEYNEAYDEEYEESGIEPTFDVPIVNITVVAGQTALLPCSIEALGKYKVAWLDQQNMALTFDDRRYVDDVRFSVVHKDPKEWNLQIKKVRWEDQGQYRCTINTEPGKSKSAVLHVKVPAKIVDDLSSTDVTVEEGETVLLKCNVTGVPHPEVTWYRRPAPNQLTYRETKKCKPHTHGPGEGRYGELIIIRNVSRYCDDIYECVADNGVPPSVSRQMRVTVEFAPEITLPNRRISQDLGRQTILECIITAFPHAQNMWRKNGREIKNKPNKYRIQPYDDGDHTITLSLSIDNIAPEDYGEYECQASNQLGSDRESMFLYENVKTDDVVQHLPPDAPFIGGTYKSGGPTEPSPKYTISKDHPNSIHKYNKAKMGQYTNDKSIATTTAGCAQLMNVVVAMLVAMQSFGTL